MLEDFSLIISDTSCLIILDKINELDLLKLGQQVHVTPSILKEFGKDLPDWITISSPKNSYYKQILEMDLDEGEASAIALSLDLKNSILIIDDLKARKLVEKLNLKYSGTLGLILKAKQTGLIQGVKPIIEKIRESNFRIDKKLLDTILDLAGES